MSFLSSMFWISEWWEAIGYKIKICSSQNVSEFKDLIIGLISNLKLYRFVYPKKYNFYATGKIIKFSCWCHKWYTKLDFFIIRYKWNSEKCMCCQAALYRISFGVLMIYMELITQVEPCMDRKMVTSIWDYKELLWFINQLMHKKWIWGV